jgi:hypothetical protein
VEEKGVAAQRKGEALLFVRWEMFSLRPFTQEAVYRTQRHIAALPVGPIPLDPSSHREQKIYVELGLLQP